MKKIFVLLILALVVAFSACSSEPEVEIYEPTAPVDVETPEPETPEPIETTEEPEIIEDEEEYPTYEPATQGSNIHGAIHRVEYGGNVAYLFGTIHGGHAHWFPLADVVEDALRRADVVAVEVAEIATGSDTFDDSIMEAMFLPDGLTWVDILPEDEYRHLVETLRGWGLVYEHTNTMNPAFLISILELQFLLSISEFNIDWDVTVDVYITAVATELGLPVIGLESIEQQIDIVYNPPFEVMLARIMSFLSPNELLEMLYESDELTLDEMAFYYENNNFEPINRSFAQTLGADVECLYAIYMREIASNWRSTYYANEIMRLLQETEEPTTFFVAVGLSHINRSEAGEEFTDIVQQMRLAGFNVMPIWE